MNSSEVKLGETVYFANRLMEIESGKIFDTYGETKSIVMVDSAGKIHSLSVKDCFYTEQEVKDILISSFELKRDKLLGKVFCLEEKMDNIKNGIQTGKKAKKREEKRRQLKLIEPYNYEDTIWKS